MKRLLSRLKRRCRAIWSWPGPFVVNQDPPTRPATAAAVLIIVILAGCAARVTEREAETLGYDQLTPAEKASIAR